MTKTKADLTREGLTSPPPEDPAPGPLPALRSVLAWYFSQPIGFLHGGGRVPFYCDPALVGAFAVAPEDLAVGDDHALFRLFILLAMYQALRDVVIMRQQRALSTATLRTVADATQVGRAIAGHSCSAFKATETFETTCDVFKHGGLADCGHHPGVPCLVKEATLAFRRMGDMGKLPSSAWLRIWQDGGMKPLLAEVCALEPDPAKRAHLLVERFAQIHRVGRKLSTMFVSALSTPSLAPGLTPWFPEVDGNSLVVVDTNVARAIDRLRGPGVTRTYGARESWLRDQAALIDLSEYHADLPSYSPRLVQQALYGFCSKSNRVAGGDACAERTAPCEGCAPSLCPFGGIEFHGHTGVAIWTAATNLSDSHF